MAKDDQGIDYTAEGATPPQEKNDPTAKGYDEAVDSGPAAYGVAEGVGGVFGTTGGGSYSGGMHVEERPVITPSSPPDDEADPESRRER